MVAKKEIARPESYVLNDYSAQHLRMLESRMNELLINLKPAFEKATKITPFKERKMNYIQNVRPSTRFTEPSELQEWLVYEKNKLSEFAKKVEDGERVLEDKPLNHLRRIRAFFIRFESIAKASDNYGNKSNFKVVEPLISKIILEEFAPPSKGGALALTRKILNDEEFHSRDDLGKVRDLLRVGKTIKYVVQAQIRLSNEKTATDKSGAIDGLAFPSGDDEADRAVAATPRTSRKTLPAELPLNDERTSKTPKSHRKKVDDGRADRNQLTLPL